MAFNIGGSSSSSRSQSAAQSTDQSQSQSVGMSQERLAFGDLFQSLFGGASTAASAANLPTYKGEAAMLFSGGKSFLDSLQEGGAGEQYMEGRLGDDQILGRQIQTLTDSLMSGFGETLAQTRSGSIASNTFGGGRQGVAEGIASRGLMQQLQQGVTGLMTADRSQKDSIAGTLAERGTANSLAGLSSLGSMLGISEAGATADLLPYEILSKIMGGPTSLTDSFQASASSSYGQSTANSSSRSKSGSFGFGF